MAIAWVRDTAHTGEFWDMLGGKRSIYIFVDHKKNCTLNIFRPSYQSVELGPVPLREAMATAEAIDAMEDV